MWYSLHIHTTALQWTYFVGILIDCDVDTGACSGSDKGSCLLYVAGE